VEWWAATYEAIKNGECEIDDPTFGELMVAARATTIAGTAPRGSEPISVEQTIEDMLKR
jgi:hypothetical protein